MRFGISLPAFADFSDPLVLAEAAGEAESAGWDGFFIWDAMFFDPTFHPIADPWVSLAAVAILMSAVAVEATRESTLQSSVAAVQVPMPPQVPVPQPGPNQPGPPQPPAKGRVRHQQPGQTKPRQPSVAEQRARAAAARDGRGGAPPRDRPAARRGRCRAW